MLSELLPEEKRRLHEIEQQLIELERGNINIQPSDVLLGLQEVNARFNDLDKLIQKEPKNKKDDFRRRLQHLRTTHNHVRESLDNYLKRTGGNDFNQQKAKLLANTNVSKSTEDLALEMAENGSLTKSSQMIGEYISMGQETLSELVSQKERLKGVQRKALDIMNYLGLSNSLMRGVERRDSVDKVLVFAGMALILVLMVLIWWFFRK